MIGNLFYLLRNAGRLLDVIGPVVIAVEALKVAASASSEEARAAAVAKAKAQLAKDGLTPPETLIGHLIDVVVWVLNNITNRRWSQEVAEAIEPTLEDAAGDVIAPMALESAELEAREEFAQIEARGRSGRGEQ